MMGVGSSSWTDMLRTLMTCWTSRVCHSNPACCGIHIEIALALLLYLYSSLFPPIMASSYRHHTFFFVVSAFLLITAIFAHLRTSIFQLNAPTAALDWCFHREQPPSTLCTIFWYLSKYYRWDSCCPTHINGIYYIYRGRELLFILTTTNQPK